MKPRSNPSEPNPRRSYSQPIGQLLVKEGKLLAQDIPRIVEFQKRIKLLFGETAVRLGLTTEDDVNLVLARQYAFTSVIANLDAFNPLLVTAISPLSQSSEAFRTLRSELMLRWKSAKKKLLTVTGSRTGHGASVLAANLAIVFAQASQRTLVIDANLRTPAQHNLFRIDSGLGLAGVLNDRCEFPDATSSIVPIENLFVLPAGAPPANPLELLSRAAFFDVITSAYAQFDVVIIDTPPILDVADARMISSQTGHCLLAVKRGATTLSDANRVRAVLAPTGAVLLGAVISE